MPSQEPNLITLADQFAISDDYFSLADSPSWVTRPVPWTDHIIWSQANDDT